MEIRPHQPACRPQGQPLQSCCAREEYSFDREQDKYEGQTTEQVLETAALARQNSGRGLAAGVPLTALGVGLTAAGALSALTPALVLPLGAVALYAGGGFISRAVEGLRQAAHAERFASELGGQAQSSPRCG